MEALMSCPVTLVLVGDNPGVAFAHHSELPPFFPENPWDHYLEEIPGYREEVRRIGHNLGQSVAVRDAEKLLTKEVFDRVVDRLNWEDVSITLLLTPSLQAPLKFGHLYDSVVVYWLCSGEVELHPFTYGGGV